ncbi:hypothetical protein FQV27_07510 [Paracoccus aurantiacus]|uniref:Excinuclease ABC subunit A n=1 Tax=Paracoccus aurantiacus TaxID=2599412 RepID=A0A5C6S603_9RHOB|nr:hypothetical protein [Paracoccus aurantiacus]TXB69946.1 hypothetical protein FQV27_07510 [Paracoccus aurantiacus]
MNTGSILTMTAVLASLAFTPALADPGKGNGNGKGNKHHKSAGDSGRHGDGKRVNYAKGCPPGLAKKDPACVPPGQAKKYNHERDRDGDRDHVRDHDRDRDHYRTGDVFRVGDYTIIRDLDRYGLERRDDWRYYRDGDRAYRVDSNTRKVLAVVELIDAFN